MAIRTLQVTLNGSVQPISATPLKCQWATFVNGVAAQAQINIGDANVSATSGIPLAVGGAPFTTPVAPYSTFGTDLSEWSAIGTATQVLSIVYDSMVF